MEKTVRDQGDNRRLDIDEHRRHPRPVGLHGCDPHKLMQAYADQAEQREHGDVAPFHGEERTPEKYQRHPQRRGDDEYPPKRQRQRLDLKIVQQELDQDAGGRKNERAG